MATKLTTKEKKKEKKSNTKVNLKNTLSCVKSSHSITHKRLVNKKLSIRQQKPNNIPLPQTIIK